MNDLIGKNVKTLKRLNQYDVKILYTQYFRWPYGIYQRWLSFKRKTCKKVVFNFSFIKNFLPFFDFFPLLL